MTTGPNTEEGKAAVAANGIKHGLRSEKIVLPEVESIEEWEDFRDGVLESVKPVGRLEDELANRVAQLSWRLRRGLRAEHDAVAGMRSAAPNPSTYALGTAMLAVLDRIAPSDASMPVPEPSVPVAAPAARPLPSLPNEGVLAKIMRYEAQYTRQLFQTLHALQAIQDRRHGKTAPPVRIQWH